MRSIRSHATRRELGISASTASTEHDRGVNRLPTLFGTKGAEPSQGKADCARRDDGKTLTLIHSGLAKPSAGCLGAAVSGTHRLVLTARPEPGQRFWLAVTAAEHGQPSGKLASWQSLGGSAPGLEWENFDTQWV